MGFISAMELDRMSILSNYVLLAIINTIYIIFSEVYVKFQYWGHGFYISALKLIARKLKFGIKLSILI